MMDRENAVRGGLQEQIIGSLIGFLVHLYSKLLRVEITIAPSVQVDEQQYLYCFWHNRVLVLPECFQRLTRAPLVCLTSASPDGAITEAMMAAFGIGAIRGSSSRRGKRAMIDMIRALRDGSSLAISPDGPRGPVYDLNPGIIKLASKTGTPIVPVRLLCSHYWELKTWDKFRIPMPFAKIQFEMCTPHLVPKTLDEEQLTQLKTELEEIITF